MLRKSREFRAQEQMELLEVQHSADPKALRDKLEDLANPGRPRPKGPGSFGEGLAQLAEALGDPGKATKIRRRAKARQFIKEQGSGGNG